MSWIAFSYSLSAKSNTTRVALWRRLRRLGALSPTGGVYLLPSRDDCLESFQWLAQEIRQAGGEALVMHVPQFEGLEDGQLIEVFNQAREEQYEDIASQAAELEGRIEASDDDPDPLEHQDLLAKLHKQHAEVLQIDYFRSQVGSELGARLNRIGRQLLSGDPSEPHIAKVPLARYRDRRWVTRPRPHVDRLACAWLIRRFIHPEAVIRYAPTPEADEVAFDMPDAGFSHQGNLCTFEVMLRAFDLEEAALHTLAEIVHEIDLRDGRYLRPETSGIDAALRGWLLAGIPDGELEKHGLALFEGLYAALTHAANAS